MPVLQVQHLTKTFKSGFWPFTNPKEYAAVNAISFHVKEGEILGFLGPNGAGKTTTIQMLLGTLTPSSGSINYFGNNFANKRIESLQRIGYASGYDKLPARLTVIENLDIIGRIYNIPNEARAKHIEMLLHSFQLWDLRNQQTGTLSAGQSTRVMLAKAFMNNPEIVLLDEPTASLDPDVAFQVRQFILAQRKERGASVLITSHNMQEVTELCDRVLVLKNGSIVADNSPQQLANSIKKAHVHLDINRGLELALKYLQEMNIVHSIDNNHISIEIDETAIATFLIELSERTITYTQITIDKPTLEDYFISVARGGKA